MKLLKIDSEKKTSIFIDIYLKSIEKKLYKFFMTMGRVLRTPASDLSQQDIEDYFDSNRQCKLPWTRAEILNASEFFCTFLANNKITTP